ncbi:hypothetical protein BC834DRAFT_885606 [Gloeopeniophorella convolvens]|nr:hypothetical protein BC834DRAFT_885606 [Gloeopeniophorella convolvens]
MRPDRGGQHAQAGQREARKRTPCREQSGYTYAHTAAASGIPGSPGVRNLTLRGRRIRKRVANWACEDTRGSSWL